MILMSQEQWWALQIQALQEVELQEAVAGATERFQWTLYLGRGELSSSNAGESFQLQCRAFQQLWTCILTRYLGLAVLGIRHKPQFLPL